MTGWSHSNGIAMKKEIKVVIGANFGDEGKGLMTDYFCHQLSEAGHDVLNIRHNGGAQAAHNVVTPDGKQHVFHHFGAGSFNRNTDTYLAGEFILNPVLFCRELDELKKLDVNPKVYINKNCRITTPYDMMVNQILERRRGDSRHGSCGIGINETIERYNSFHSAVFGCNSTVDNIRWHLFSDGPGSYKNELRALLTWYIPVRLSALGITLTKEEQELFESKTVMDNFIAQLQDMMNRCTVVDDSIIRNYSGLVFEGAQGLLLDTDYIVFAPHLTSSKTGSYNPKKIIFENELQNEKIEFCYVTRPYFTRHGFGPFPTECDVKELFGKYVEEKHNHENEFQGKFRFGYFDTTRFENAVDSDLKYMLCSFPNAVGTIAITHLDDTGGMVFSGNTKFLALEIDQLKYTSCGETRNCIKSKKKGRGD